ncbi:sensor histidine kinase [Thalassotalea marina]|uniref:ATPase n=1 Tax=Thalassotalea marina TaxID=1673741 RepID=A0A919EFY1_9GAMM|nr:histidine kinase [Thalassotalea marina]GHF77968.1 ATPase [Thalassotalea marina]
MIVEQDATLRVEPQLFSKQSHQFWTLQISGWIGYTLVVFIAIIRPQFDDPQFNLSGQIINLGIEVLSGFILSYVLWLVIQKTVHLPLRLTLTISFATAGLLGLIYNIIKLASYKTVVYHQVWYQQWNMLEFGGWLLFSLSTMLVWTAIFFIMLYNTRLQKEHEMLLRAQTAAKDAQLQMLRYQLNPHFMFNTMNAISTLIYKKDNDKAGEMLDKLCAFFRFTLDENTSKVTTLAQEINLLELYLSIEKVRFGERLQVKTDIDNSLLQMKVPSLLLQPIVENAIKYGVEMSKERGLIVISAKQKDGYCQIAVTNEGAVPQQNQRTGFGIGLNNTKERIDTMYSGNAIITVTPSSTSTTVTLKLPYALEEAHAI